MYTRNLFVQAKSLDTMIVFGGIKLVIDIGRCGPRVSRYMALVQTGTRFCDHSPAPCLLCDSLAFENAAR